MSRCTQSNKENIMSTIVQALLTALALCGQATAPEVLAQAPTIVECSTDTECLERNPDVDEDAERITEDDPRWECSTMGNRICGPVVTSGDSLIDANGWVFTWADDASPIVTACVAVAPCNDMVTP
jgi:hypothetical protein